MINVKCEMQTVKWGYMRRGHEGSTWRGAETGKRRGTHHSNETVIYRAETKYIKLNPISFFVFLNRIMGNGRVNQWDTASGTAAGFLKFLTVNKY